MIGDGGRCRDSGNVTLRSDQRTDCLSFLGRETYGKSKCCLCNTMVPWLSKDICIAELGSKLKLGSMY